VIAAGNGWKQTKRNKMNEIIKKLKNEE